MLNLKKSLIGSCALLVSVLLTACGSEAPPPQAYTPAVNVVTLQSQAVTLTRQLPGRTNPFKVAEVRPQVNGLVKQQLFKEGGLVDAGQSLYQLDDATYQADYDSAKAVLQSAEAALIAERLNAERVRELVKTGAVSKQQNDASVASLAKAEADVASARAALKRSKIQLDYARITAPIAGRIGVSTVTQGALVTANQSAALATVQQLDPIYVDLTQSVGELLNLRKALEAGTVANTDDYPVSILLEDGSRYQHDGKLEFSEVTVDPSTGSVLLRVLVPNPENNLLPGMYVRAVIGRGVREHAILVPQQGISRDPKGNTTAMVVGADNKVEMRQVSVSQTIGSQWLVESGLAAGDKVIVEGLQKVRPGAAVSATEIVLNAVESHKSQKSQPEAEAKTTTAASAASADKG